MVCRAHRSHTKLYLAHYKSSGKRAENVNKKPEYMNVIMQRCIISLDLSRSVQVEAGSGGELFVETIKARQTAAHCCFCAFDFPATRWKEILHVPALPAVQ